VKDVANTAAQLLDRLRGYQEVELQAIAFYDDKSEGSSVASSIELGPVLTPKKSEEEKEDN
jgi:hypothetical protein